MTTVDTTITTTGVDTLVWNGTELGANESREGVEEEDVEEEGV